MHTANINKGDARNHIFEVFYMPPLTCRVAYPKRSGVLLIMTMKARQISGFTCGPDQEKVIISSKYDYYDLIAEFKT